MLVLSCIISGLEFWLVNHTSIFENSDSKGLENAKVLGKTSNNWAKDLLGINVYKTAEYWKKILLAILQWTSTTSVISKWGKISPFSSFLSYFYF